jgi:hypothetical protein
LVRSSQCVFAFESWQGRPGPRNWPKRLSPLMVYNRIQCKPPEWGCADLSLLPTHVAGRRCKARLRRGEVDWCEGSDLLSARVPLTRDPAQHASFIRSPEYRNAARCPRGTEYHFCSAPCDPANRKVRLIFGTTLVNAIANRRRAEEAAGRRRHVPHVSWPCTEPFQARDQFCLGVHRHCAPKLGLEARPSPLHQRTPDKTVCEDANDQRRENCPKPTRPYNHQGSRARTLPLTKRTTQVPDEVLLLLEPSSC